MEELCERGIDMGRINVTKEQVELAVKYGCKLILVGLAFKSLWNKRGDTLAVESCGHATGYSDAVDAILNSSMLDSSKRTVIGMLKHDEDLEYYKSVIMTINSNMFDSEKIRIIEKL